jgi:hypothetical protein
MAVSSLDTKSGFWLQTVCKFTIRLFTPIKFGWWVRRVLYYSLLSAFIMSRLIGSNFVPAVLDPPLFSGRENTFGRERSTSNSGPFDCVYTTYHRAHRRHQ